MTAPSEPVHVSALPIESTGGGADAATTGKPERRRVAGVVAVGLILASLYALAAQARYPGGGDAPYHILTARTWFSGGHFIPGDPTQTKFPPGWSLIHLQVTRHPIQPASWGTFRVCTGAAPENC